jgi:glutamyl-tRNA synthetase
VRFGWSHGDKEVFSRQELIELFSWDAVNKSDGKFDEKKFADVAFEHLKRPELMPLEEYVRRLKPFLAARGLIDVVDEELLAAAIRRSEPRARWWIPRRRGLYFRSRRRSTRGGKKF